MQKKQFALFEKIRAKTNEVQKNLECDILQRYKQIDKELSNQTNKAERLNSIIQGISTKLNSLFNPSNSSSECTKELSALETLMNEYVKNFQEEIVSSGINPYTAQDIPSSFLNIIEPDLGIEVIENKKLKNGLESGRNAGIYGNPSQMTEVRYKDTFSTCDNRTIGNNLELTAENQLTNEQELLSGNFLSQNTKNSFKWYK